MVLEGLWWWDDPNAFNLEDAPPREDWNWKSMIRQFTFVTREMEDEVSPEVKEKRGPRGKSLNGNRFRVSLRYLCWMVDIRSPAT